MLRSYLNGRTQASDIFDTQLIGRYLGIAEVLGGLHPLIFHNFLFNHSVLKQHLGIISLFLRGTETLRVSFKSPFLFII